MTAEYISYKRIIDCISDIKSGDIVYLISDVLNLAKTAREHGERFDKNAFIDSIIEKIGDNGTLLIPAFNWGFCNGKVFDYRNTPSESGALGNAALHRDDFKRTKHPIYSFCVWGKDKEILFERDPLNAFGKETIFEYIVEKRAKALIIDLPTMDRNVICHHIEKIVDVPFRFEKTFISEYIDWNGVSSKKSYSMFVRDYSYEAMEQLAPMNFLLELLGITHTIMINNIPFRICMENEAAEVLMIDMKYNDCLNTYRYKGQKKRAELKEYYEIL